MAASAIAAVVEINTRMSTNPFCCLVGMTGTVLDGGLIQRPGRFTATDAILSHSRRRA
jgi:hypothetical protein